MSNLSAGLLRSQISAVRKKSPSSNVIGLRSRADWTEGDLLKVDQEEFLIRSCQSELEIREALLEAEDQNRPVVVLSSLPDAELSRDLLTRFARRKFLRLDVWDSLRDLFKAKEIDSRLRRLHWLVDMLMESLPSEGYRPAPNGVLTLEHIWSEYFRISLQIPNVHPDARDLLSWSSNTEGVTLYQALDADSKSDVKQWVGQRAGELGIYLLNFIEQGKRSLLLASGLVCEIIFDDEAAGVSTCRDAVIRLEKYNGEQPIPRALGKAWAMATKDYLKSLPQETSVEVVSQVQTGLDRLLDDLGILELAWMSSYSLEGFEQRLERFGSELTIGLKKKGPTPITSLWKLAEASQNHFEYKSNPDRVERLYMACRLRQWLCEEPTESADFQEAALKYYTEGGFVDRARNELLGGEGNESLSRSFTTLLKHLDLSRTKFAETFATKLASWVESGTNSTSLLCVEDVLKDVCAPLSETSPILFIVMDGMSMAVYRQLQEDLILRYRWVEYAPNDSHWPRPGLAALPSVTEVSRCSLLCGRLTRRDQDDEKKGFKSQKDLLDAWGAQPPILFHKKDLIASGGTELSEVLLNEMKSSKRRVVGAVVNAVDDHLLKGDQIHFPWSVSRIPVLEKLLFAAKETGRAVVLTSDHGHVFDRSSKYQVAEPGERYRLDTPTPGKGELEFKGSRVVVKGARIIAPWVENLRYGPKKNGYHGGVNPQEMVIPVSVLAPNWDIKGWSSLPYARPDWWMKQLEEPALGSPMSQARLKPKKNPESDLPLFAEVEMKSASKSKLGWIDEMLESEVLVAQKKLAGRAPLPDDLIKKFISCVHEQGGTILAPTLALRIKQPPLRIRGMVTSMQRLLNVEGYGVLKYDASSETVTLDLDLLKSQFEISS